MFCSFSWTFCIATYWAGVRPGGIGAGRPTIGAGDAPLSGVAPAAPAFLAAPMAPADLVAPAAGTAAVMPAVAPAIAPEYYLLHSLELLLL